MENESAYAARRTAWERSYAVFSSPYFLLALGALLLSFVSLFAAPMSHDEGVWAYIARIWYNDHIVPYTGVIDNKALGMVYLNVVSYALFGINGWFLRVAGILATLMTAVLLLLTAKTIAGNKSAGVFTMALFLLMMPLGSVDGAYAMTETFMNLFVVASVYSALKATGSRHRRRLIVLSGMLWAAALTFRQSAVVAALPLAFLILQQHGYRWKAALPDGTRFCMGTGIALAASVIPYMLGGGTILGYMKGAWLILLQHDVGIGARGILTRGTGFLTHFFQSTVYLPFLGVIALVYAYWTRLGLAAVREKRDMVRFVLFWALTDFISYNLEGAYYPHHIKIFILSWSLCFGVASYLVLKNLRASCTENNSSVAQSNDGNKKATLWLLGALFLFFVIFQTDYYAKVITLVKGTTAHDLRALGLTVKENTKPGDFLFVWGLHTGPIYYYSERRSPSRYFETYFLRETGALAELQKDFFRNKPAAVLVAAVDDSPPEWLTEALTREYIFSRAAYGTTIYLLKEKIDAGRGAVKS